MICLVCRRSEVVDSLTSVNFRRGEMHLIINDVPARVCRNCGEAYVGEEVAVRLLQSAEEVYRLGILENVVEYEKLRLK